MFNYKSKSIFSAVMLSMFFIQCSRSQRISQSLCLNAGAVNGVIVGKEGQNLVIYGDPYNKIKKADIILFTHFRRDVIWAGIDLVKNGSFAVAPALQREYFDGNDSLWSVFQESRFHDYYCQTTKFGIHPLKVDRYVTGGDTIKWQDIEFKVLNTPGYTRGSVSYIADIDGKKFAFTGDLIYGNGKILDLYSFQDSFQEIRGYHGYAARLVQLISSLKLIALQKPDIIIPSRGPVINDPAVAIQNLIQNVRHLYSNYLSINAYRWYFPERMNALSDSILGSFQKVDWMPFSEVISNDPPEWYVHKRNSNLVIAEDSTAFLIDCGVKEAYTDIMKLKESGRIKSIDGMFITHYHDDHTEYINEIVEKFGSPVYVTAELKDILENPGAYQMPCLTTKSIRNLVIVADGENLKWKDFNITFHYFPGQTIYHDAVLFQKDGGESIFFIGDSFSPTGIDDYCLLNRNLVHPGKGYFYCLDVLKNLPDNVLLSNQHIGPLFSFSREQLERMSNSLLDRNQILKDLLPFDDINYGIDEQWAKIYPYDQKGTPGGTIEYAVKIFNHSATKKTFVLDPNPLEGFDIEPKKASLVIEPQSESRQSFRVRISKQVPSGVSLLTINVGFDNWDFHEWCEAMIEISY
jgi:glyoxylase-like metal-dependent hydrolase (beta-lactamase superfamily II)